MSNSNLSTPTIDISNSSNNSFSSDKSTPAEEKKSIISRLTIYQITIMLIPLLTLILLYIFQPNIIMKKIEDINTDEVDYRQLFKYGILFTLASYVLAIFYLYKTGKFQGKSLVNGIFDMAKGKL